MKIMTAGRIFQAILSNRQNSSPKYADKMPFTCMACIEKVHGMVFLFVGMGMRGNFCSSYPCDCMTVGMRGLSVWHTHAVAMFWVFGLFPSCNTHVDSIFWVFGLPFGLQYPCWLYILGIWLAFWPAIPSLTLC